MGVDPVVGGVASAVVLEEETGPQPLQQDGERRQSCDDGEQRWAARRARGRSAGSGRWSLPRLARCQSVVMRYGHGGGLPLGGRQKTRPRTQGPPPQHWLTM